MWWDLILKLLLRESPQDLLTWVLPGAIFVGWRETQFQKRGQGRRRKRVKNTLSAHEIRADSLMEVVYQGRRYLIHVELQSTKDGEIGYRLLGYSHGAIGLYHLPVLSYVIYVLPVPDPPASPYEWPGTGSSPRMSFEYDSIELAELAVEEVEQKQLVGVAPLLLLTKGGATREVLERAIMVLEQARKAEALAILRLLATQVFQNDQEMVAWIEWRFTTMHDSWIEESLMYKELVQKGEIKGFEKGEIKGFEKGLRQSIMEVVRARFPDLLDLARKRVARVHGEEQLREILIRLVIIPTEGEAHRFLTTLGAGRA